MTSTRLTSTPSAAFDLEAGLAQLETAKAEWLAEAAASTPSHHSTVPLWVVFADGDADQICETAAIANRERADLKKMGFVVTVKKVIGWETAEAIMDGDKF